MYTMVDGRPVSLGVAFGYCFVPQVQEKPHGASSVTSFSPSGDGKTWQAHPFCKSQEEAEKWLRDRGLGGVILRYAHHEPVEKRGEEYRPWVTAGVVAKIDGKALTETSPVFAKAVEWSQNHGEQLRKISAEQNA